MYRGRGVDDSLARRELESGVGVSLFFLGYSPSGEVVGGIRFHGPLQSSDEASLIVEMSDSSELEDIRSSIDAACPDGVLEMKGMWSRGTKAAGAELAPALTRTHLVAMRWLDAARVYNSGAERLMPLAGLCGVAHVWEEPVAYPDERYKSFAMYFCYQETLDICTSEHRAAHESDLSQLRSSAGVNYGGVGAGAYRALVLDSARVDGRAIFNLLRQDGQVRVIDHLDAQREQLGELKGQPGSLENESSRWVYYPWLDSIVSVLGPRSYSALRLERNRNKVTRDEQDKLRSLKIGVVGASAGHAIAHTLAMEGLAGEIRLADFDALEVSNLNRVPARVLDLGVNKAVVLARRIAEIDPYINVVVAPDGITPANIERFLHGLDLVVEECDSLDIKMRVREVARRLGIAVIMETSDRGLLDVERFDLDPERALFHGRLGDVTGEELSELSLAERGPYVVRLIGGTDVSARGVASLLELGMTLTGWPQLGSEVTLGAASVAAAVRRFGTGKALDSGRVRIDLDEQLDALADGDDSSGDSLLAGLLLPIPTDPETERTDPVSQIVDAARRAPSGGNVQPWRFEASESEIRFYVDAARSKSAMDIKSRGSFVGVGAAVFNARVRASRLGVLGPVALLPEGESAHLLATMALGSGSDFDMSGLDGSISDRCTNRRNGVRGELGPRIIADLHRAVKKEGAELHLLTDPAALNEVGALVGEADKQRFLLSGVHQEMMGELRWPGRDSLDDGLDVRALELDEAGYASMSLIKRGDVMGELASWRLGAALGMRTHMAIAGGSGLALLSVPRSSTTGYVRGGQALERFWLSGQKHGVAIQPCAPLYIYADGDEDLLELGGERNVDALAAGWARFRAYFDLSGTDVMIMVLRLFEAPAPSVHSIRRSLDEVLCYE
jgi:hypothetical protein